VQLHALCFVALLWSWHVMGLGEVEGKFDDGWRFLWRLTGVRVFVEWAL
jgi:hypothetical protein